MMKVLVVTGGIGSGKSLVCRILTDRYGIPVYEADRRAKQLYVEVPSMLDDIEAVLGVKVRGTEGRFVPELLAKVIFSDNVALRKVEDILFPAMIRDFQTWAERQNAGVVAFESATILEKPQFDGFGDLVLLVDAPAVLRMARTMERDNASEESVLARMKAQPLMNRLSDGAREHRVDHVLTNDSTMEDLVLKMDKFIEKYGLTKVL